MPNISVSTNFPQGFANGVSVRGMPLLQAQPGQVFFVGNGATLLPNQKAGSDNNRGTFLDPFATLNNAINTVCSPYQNRGDIIFVMQGHKETISSATALAMNTAGIAVIGLGAGNARPTFTLDTAATTTIKVNAANCSIQNCLFIGNFLSITSLFTAVSASFTGSIAPYTTGLGLLTITGTPTGTVLPGQCIVSTTATPGTIILSQLSGTTGAAGTYVVNNSQTLASGSLTTGPQDFALDNNEYRDISTTLGFLSIFTDNSTANSCDGFQFTRSNIQSKSTVSPTVALTFQSAHDRMKWSDNFSVSPVTAVTQGPALAATGSASMTNIEIARNRFYRPNTSTTLPVGISTTGTAWSGYAFDNYFWNLGASTGIWINTGTKLGFQNNYSPITGAADKSGLINPAAV